MENNVKIRYPKKGSKEERKALILQKAIKDGSITFIEAMEVMDVFYTDEQIDISVLMKNLSNKSY